MKITNIGKIERSVAGNDAGMRRTPRKVAPYYVVTQLRGNILHRFTFRTLAMAKEKAQEHNCDSAE